MYEDRNEPAFDAPIPGMSLTHEVGARPWQQPSQYSTIEEVAQFYIGQMQNDSFAEQTVNLLQTKMPVTMIANAMQTSNIMNGIHNIDVGVLALPIIMEMIMLIGDSANIDYVIGTERNLEEEVKDSAMALAVSKIEDVKSPMEEESVEEMPEETMQEMQEDTPTGLMSRRN
jgi:hypothetical protein